VQSLGQALHGRGVRRGALQGGSTVQYCTVEPHPSKGRGAYLGVQSLGQALHGRGVRGDECCRVQGISGHGLLQDLLGLRLSVPAKGGRKEGGGERGEDG